MGTFCTHVMTEQKGQKIGFYYAVQEGGDFNIHYDVRDPEGHIFTEDEARGVDMAFAAQKIGEYTFCFKNGTLELTRQNN